MRKPVEKGRIARCPYCGRYLNYFVLYDSRHYDFGHCNHCGGVFAVKFSGWIRLLSVLALGAAAGGILLQFLADKSLPSWKFFLTMAGIMAVIYVLFPLFVVPTKCVIGGKLGGFPSRDMMPEPLRSRTEEPEEPSDELSRAAQEMFFSVEEEEPAPEQSAEPETEQSLTAEAPVDEPTVVAERGTEPLTAEERFRRAQQRQNAGRR